MSDFVPAKRGDFIVTECERTTSYAKGGGTTRTQFEIHEVTNIFRDGRVKRTSDVGWTDPSPQELSRQIGLKRWYLIPASQIPDREAFVAAVRAHVYPNSTTPMDWDSLDEVRALVKPFRVKETAA